jgi:hypothetical protein
METASLHPALRRPEKGSSLFETQPTYISIYIQIYIEIEIKQHLPLKKAYPTKKGISTEKTDSPTKKGISTGKTDSPIKKRHLPPKNSSVILKEFFYSIIFIFIPLINQNRPYELQKVPFCHCWYYHTGSDPNVCTKS